MYIDSLISNIRQDAREGRPSDMASYYNWTTFDIIGDLSFAQSFDALKTRTTHPWIKTFFSNLGLFTVMAELSSFSIFGTILRLCLYPIVAPLRDQLVQYCNDSVQKRLRAGDLDRPDFLGKVLQQNSEKDEKSMMSDEEINLTFQVLMVAGSETTATLLAGCTYLLQKNPRVLEKLKSEIRGAFQEERDINMLSVRRLNFQVVTAGAIY
jgi:cytochrome P450